VNLEPGVLHVPKPKAARRERSICRCRPFSSILFTRPMGCSMKSSSPRTTRISQPRPENIPKDSRYKELAIHMVIGNAGEASTEPA